MVKIIAVPFPLGMQLGENYDCFSKVLIFIYLVNDDILVCVCVWERERERELPHGYFKGQVVLTVKSFFVKQNS